MKNIRKYLNTQLCEILGNLGFNVSDALVTVSNRPDLADYQSNAVMMLSKKHQVSPGDILDKLLPEIRKLQALSEVSTAGPGFINMRLSDNFLSDIFSDLSDITPEKFSNRRVIIDYGGPNIAKEMHVGHLRSAIIGESIKRIMRVCGDEVIGDVHFGDWGTPIGMLIVQLEQEQPELAFFKEPFDTGSTGAELTIGIAELSALYVRAANSFKTNEVFKDKARAATSLLQSGRPGYLALWKVFRTVSEEAVRRNYNQLLISFDWWLGESDVNDILPQILDNLSTSGLAIHSQGAIIVPLKDKKGQDKAPLILKKSDGAYTYAATDLATIIQRKKDFNPEVILYVTDMRQKEHMDQVFEVAGMAGLVSPEVSFEHISFGTVNGTDGKPFKTREGGVMRLDDLITLAINKAKENLPGETDVEDARELESQAEKIAIASIKYQDLKNNRASDYVFDMEDFTKSEGKTGPYLQYAVARINSILSKAADQGLSGGRICVSNQFEREIMLVILRLPEIMEVAYQKREPSVISDFAYNLAQRFSTLYNNVKILGESDLALKQSRLKIAALTRQALVYALYLLGIEAPQRMLRR